VKEELVLIGFMSLHAPGVVVGRTHFKCTAVFILINFVIFNYCIHPPTYTWEEFQLAFWLCHKYCLCSLGYWFQKKATGFKRVILLLS